MVEAQWGCPVNGLLLVAVYKHKADLHKADFAREENIKSRVFDDKDRQVLPRAH